MHFVSAQTVTYSSYELDDKGFEYSKVIGEYDEGVYVLQSNLSFDFNGDHVGFKTRKYRLMCFDFNLKPLWKQEVTPNMKGQEIEQIISANGQVLMIMSMDKGENNYDYYLQWINTKGVSSGSGTPAFKIQFVKGSTVGRINTTTSLNHKYVLMLLPEVLSDKKQVFHLIGADSTLDVTYKKQLALDFTTEQFTPDEFDVSNNGDAAISGVYNDNSGSRKNKQVNSINKVYLFKASETDPVAYDFKIPEKNINVSSITFDNVKSQLVIAGFYFDKASTTGSGVAFARYDVNGGPAKIYYTPVNNESGSLKGERNSVFGAGLMNYEINKITLRSDSGLVITAEAISISESTYFDNFTNTLTTRTQYNYNNMLLMSVNADGSIDWSKLIRKEQESVDDGGVYSSYLPMINDQSIYIYFNRNIYQNNEVMNVSITNTGNQNEKDLIRNTDHVMILARFGKQVSAEEAIVPVVQKKRMVLAKISFL